MTIEDSILTIRDYQDQWGIKGLLETLEQMQICFDDLNDKQAAAYRTFTYFGRQFFAEVE